MELIDDGFGSGVGGRPRLGALQEKTVPVDQRRTNPRTSEIDANHETAHGQPSCSDCAQPRHPRPQFRRAERQQTQDQGFGSGGAQVPHGVLSYPAVGRENDPLLRIAFGDQSPGFAQAAASMAVKALAFDADRSPEKPASKSARSFSQHARATGVCSALPEALYDFARTPPAMDRLRLARQHRTRSSAAMRPALRNRVRTMPC